MRDPHPTGLLDDHIRAIGPRLRLALTATASRNRSLDARFLLARAALGDAGTLDDLIVAARSGDRRWLRRIRRQVQPPMIAALAQTIALQEQLPEDRADAPAIFELVRRALGPASVPAAHQGLHAQLALAFDGPRRARRLLRSYRQITEPVRTSLEVDLRNPFVADRPVAPWLSLFQALLPAPAPALLAEGDTPFDRLTAATAPDRVETPHRISVVVTAYRPDQGLLTAVRSILAQTWANVEIVLVDDASPAAFDEVLRRAVALGERIRLVKLAVNGGTYAARNAGLDAAGGEFVAFQDSDDWSHPRRLELQVRPLLADRQVVATTSDGLAVTDRLMLTRPGVRSGRFNPSSLLFRRGVVLSRVGYFDRVRKAGDSEYIGRIQAAFGPAGVRHLDGVLPLALIRLSAGSLSRSEIKPHWMHPARVAYSSAYLRRHQLIADGTAPAYRSVDHAVSAPGHLLGADDEQIHEYDVVIVADWRFLESTQRTAIDELVALAGAGLRVAVLQLESYRAVYLRRAALCAPLQDLLNAGLVDQVAAHQRVEAALLIVRQAAVLQFAAGEPGRIRARRAVIVADRAPSRADGSDRRYVPVTCTVAVRRMFGAEPVWIPQDGGVRAALRTVDALVDPAAADLPTALASPGWVDERTGRPGDVPVVGTDLADAAAWPPDVAEALAAVRLVPGADVRVRLPDRPFGEVPVGLPHTWLGYQVADLGPWPFGHQLDFYLHFPSPQTAEWYSRPALEAAATGCVVIMEERFAGFYGDAAVYTEPAGVAALIDRYRSDPALFAEQSRRARAVVAKAHDPGLLVERIMGLLPVTAAATAALPMM
jgi:glycosyltransferase involved in cell wall biosynthesis